MVDTNILSTILGNAGNFKVGTGNKFIDAGLGGLIGMADAAQKRGQYVPMFNWAGNGVARGGMQYLANPDYRDYTSGGMALGAIFGNSDNKKGSTFKELGNRLNTMLNKPMFQRDTIYKYPLNTQEYTMPQFANTNIGGTVIGGTNGVYGNMYGLPTQQIQKPDWLSRR